VFCYDESSEFQPKSQFLNPEIDTCFPSIPFEIVEYLQVIVSHFSLSEFGHIRPFGLTEEAVAELMGTTKSAVSRLETAGRHVPSLTTLKKYAQAVGCHLEIKLVPNSRLTKHSTRTAKKQTAG